MKEKPAGCSIECPGTKGYPETHSMQHLFSRHLKGGLNFQMHEALLWNKKGSQWQISGKHSVKSCNFPADLPAAGTPGFPGRLPDWSKELPLRRCPSGSGRSSTQTQGNTRNTKTRKLRNWNTTFSLSPHAGSSSSGSRASSPRNEKPPCEEERWRKKQVKEELKTTS